MARVYRYTPTVARPPVSLAPGEVVWANVINAIENPLARGKLRPLVLIHANGSLWTTMGLTTNPRYRDGTARIAIPNPAAVGLRGQGWLWGNTTTRVAAIDIESHAGWVDPALAAAVIALADLRGDDAQGLVDAARIHHRAVAGGVA
jgi:hypothetical protein